jgi:hypothetical protein
VAGFYVAFYVVFALAVGLFRAVSVEALKVIAQAFFVQQAGDEFQVGSRLSIRVANAVVMTGSSLLMNRPGTGRCPVPIAARPTAKSSRRNRRPLQASARLIRSDDGCLLGPE